MIYFYLNTKIELINKFYEMSEPGGYLFIGDSKSSAGSVRNTNINDRMVEVSEMDKRNFLRTKYTSRALLEINGEVISGELVNISLNGAMIKSRDTDKFKVDDKIGIQMFITNYGTAVKIDSQGVVVRVAENELGIRFETMDLDSFTHLRNVIAYNTGEYDKIMEELVNNAKDKDEK